MTSMQDLERQSYLDRIVKDYFTVVECLADQSGSGSVLIFTFSKPMELVFVRCNGGNARAAIDTQTPAANLGVFCGDQESTPVVARVSSVKVFAPSNTTVSVWGYAYV